MKKIDCSIIILTYNTKELTATCIKSILKSDSKEYIVEIIVCDNGSSDGTEEYIKKHFPSVRFIQNGKNLGFAAGNNVGIRQSYARYILLLNSDTEVQPDAVASMIAFMDSHKKAGAATCRLQLLNGAMDPACHRGFPTPWAAFAYFSGFERIFPMSRLFGQYHMGYKDMRVPHQVDSISGAFFMVRRETLEQVGLLDESFFMYGEDIDWAYRIKQAGWEIWFNPFVWVLHKKKQSGRSHKDRALRTKTQDYFLGTMKLFYQKHYEKTYGYILTHIVYLGIWVKRLLIQLTGDK